MELPADFRRAADFHGHVCPGLAIGYRASVAAMERMGLNRAYDEELVCVVENDSCSVDAVQFLTGCTLGKGNLILRDYGKQVFTFASRSRPGRALRISLRSDAISSPGVEENPAGRREEALRRLLSAPMEELYHVDEIEFDPPGMAEIRQSVPCESCGEPTMRTRLVERDGRLLCIPCSEGWKPPR